MCSDAVPGTRRSSLVKKIVDGEESRHHGSFLCGIWISTADIPKSMQGAVGLCAVSAREGRNKKERAPFAAGGSGVIDCTGASAGARAVALLRRRLQVLPARALVLLKLLIRCVMMAAIRWNRSISF